MSTIYAHGKGCACCDCTGADPVPAPVTRKLVRELLPGDRVLGPVYDQRGEIVVPDGERVAVVTCLKSTRLRRCHRIELRYGVRVFVVFWSSATSVGEVESPA